MHQLLLYAEFAYHPPIKQEDASKDISASWRIVFVLCDFNPQFKAHQVKLFFEINQKRNLP